MTELPQGGEVSQGGGAPHARPWGNKTGEASSNPSFPPCLLLKVACLWEARPFLLGLEEAEGRQGWPGQRAGSGAASWLGASSQTQLVGSPSGYTPLADVHAPVKPVATRLLPTPRWHAQGVSNSL